MYISGRLQWSAFALSALAVFGQWGFWSQGVYSLGLNATIVWLLVIAFFCIACEIRLSHSWRWIAPLVLISLSFSLYENPWLNVVNLGVLPFAALILFANHHLVDQSAYFWNGSTIVLFSKRLLSTCRFVGKAISLLLIASSTADHVPRMAILRRFSIGVLILLPLGGMILMLLSMVDQSFKHLIRELITLLFNLTDWILLLKVSLLLVGGVVLLVCVLAWNSAPEDQPAECGRTVDDLIAGIVLGGILLIYVTFLSLQFNYLMMGELPLDYSRAEHLVKSGFWQLCSLSVINVVCFFVLYRTTGSVVQVLLKLFIIASGLIMVSAAWRMVLYDFTFGLSYEKFFASYTVVFALFVFTYLLFAASVRRRKNVGRFIAFAALWAYALSSVSPVERTIFVVNLHFSQYAGSRILPIQLSQLSLDILMQVKSQMIPGLENQTDYVTQQDLALWESWVKIQESDRCVRPWYESNLSLLLQCPR